MIPYSYNKIKKQTRCSTRCGSPVRERFYPFNKDDAHFMSLEDRIKLASEEGADVGVRINPQFDDKDVNELDITCSFRHDALDIAEEFGKMPQETAAPAANETAEDN